ncbi:apoptotic chromatin condensation inducer 1b isoform X2 [Cheilinus undulatus]|uniref:apoptotic chromatin condensation inducer 1b isoform X2 n=1 Tax=Cheilinus undulatus TaxID=241271 RepID=UPI001BD4EB34|nr:apoptotic chromatin condensation inducer 1b isoform X2 [Cheilinus undulatus]
MADEDITLDGKPLQSLRVADLKAALEQRNLPKSGQKNTLIKRLKGALMLENLQKSSSSHSGLQPNSQIGEEMSQNSFIKQYLAKQQELLRQRLEREAQQEEEDEESPAGPEDDEDDQSEDDSSSFVPDKHRSLHSQPSMTREEKRGGDAALGHAMMACGANLGPSATLCPQESLKAPGAWMQRAAFLQGHKEPPAPSPPRAVASLSVRVLGQPDRQGLPPAVPRAQEKEGTAPSEPGSAHPVLHLSRSARVSAGSRAQEDDDEDDSGDDESDDDDDWGPGPGGARRGNRVPPQPQQMPPSAPSTAARSKRKLQPPQHIPPPQVHHTPMQLRHPTPPPSPPPDLFPLPDTPKQSPPDADNQEREGPGAARRPRVGSFPPSSLQRQDSDSSSRSSSPEPPVKRKPGPLSLLVHKMEKEGAFTSSAGISGESAHSTAGPTSSSESPLQKLERKRLQEDKEMEEEKRLKEEKERERQGEQERERRKIQEQEREKKRLEEEKERKRLEEEKEKERKQLEEEKRRQKEERERERKHQEQEKERKRQEEEKEKERKRQEEEKEKERKRQEEEKERKHQEEEKEKERKHQEEEKEKERKHQEEEKERLRKRQEEEKEKLRKRQEEEKREKRKEEHQMQGRAHKGRVTVTAAQDSSSDSDSSSHSSQSSSSSQEKIHPSKPLKKAGQGQAAEEPKKTTLGKEADKSHLSKREVSEPSAAAVTEVEPDSENSVAQQPPSGAEPENSESCLEESTTPKAFVARKISLTSAKSSPATTDGGGGDADSVTAAGRKRRWGSSTSVTTKKPSISITTDSLKSLIPDIKLTQEAVVELHPEELQLSGDEESPDASRGDQDQGLKIRRTVTQVVPSDGQENGQTNDDEEVEKVEKEIQRRSSRDRRKNSVSEEASETQVSVKIEVEAQKVTPSDSLVRRSISQQKSGVSITIDDPVRTNRQPSPPHGKISNIIHVTNLVRPFTLGQLKELLNRTGSVVEDGFWIDKIKSHCFVTYATMEEAVATRTALHGVKWPQSNPKVLSVDFCEQDELDFHKGILKPEKEEKDHVTQPGTPQTRLPPLMPERDRTRERDRDRDRERERERERDRGGVGGVGGVRDLWAEREREMERRERTRGEREWDRDKIREFARPGEDGRRSRSRERERRRRERNKSKERKTDKKEKGDEPPAKLLDDLFLKTKAAPCIYWLPLTEEQVAQRLLDLTERQKERERRRKEREEEDKKREEEKKERLKIREKDGNTTASGGGGGGGAGRGADGDRERERGRDREGDKRRDSGHRPRRPSAGAGNGRRSRSRSNPRDRRR